MKHAIKAVQVSQNITCGVGSMLKRIMPVTWNVVYNGAMIVSNGPANLATA